MRLGDHGTTEYGPQDYYIERVTVHQRYVKSGRGSSYDIAIIRLSDFIPFTSKYMLKVISAQMKINRLFQVIFNPFVYRSIAVGVPWTLQGFLVM